MFTQSCFIRKDTQELRDKLKEIGLQPHPCIKPKACAFLFVNRGFYSRNEIGYQEEIERAIDCGENENLFLAIAALRDDTDAHQWFVHKSGSHWWRTEFDSFQECFNESNEDSELKYEDFHKATVEELIEYFNHEHRG